MSGKPEFRYGQIKLPFLGWTPLSEAILLGGMVGSAAMLPLGVVGYLLGWVSVG